MRFCCTQEMSLPHSQLALLRLCCTRKTIYASLSASPGCVSDAPELPLLYTQECLHALLMHPRTPTFLLSACLDTPLLHPITFFAPFSASPGCTSIASQNPTFPRPACLEPPLLHPQNLLCPTLSIAWTVDTPLLRHRTLLHLHS